MFLFSIYLDFSEVNEESEKYALIIVYKHSRHFCGGVYEYECGM